HAERAVAPAGRPGTEANPAADRRGRACARKKPVGGHRRSPARAPRSLGPGRSRAAAGRSLKPVFTAEKSRKMSRLRRPRGRIVRQHIVVGEALLSRILVFWAVSAFFFLAPVAQAEILPPNEALAERSIGAADAPVTIYEYS